MNDSFIALLKIRETVAVSWGAANEHLIKSTGPGIADSRSIADYSEEAFDIAAPDDGVTGSSFRKASSAESTARCEVDFVHFPLYDQRVSGIIRRRMLFIVKEQAMSLFSLAPESSPSRADGLPTLARLVRSGSQGGTDARAFAGSEGWPHWPSGLLSLPLIPAPIEAPNQTP